MKKSILSLTMLALFAATSAFACDNGVCSAPVIAPTMVNTGVISNQVSTSASVNSVGSSYSYAAGAAGATSNGSQVLTSPNASSRTMELTGTTTTYNDGFAYNVSTGNGNGAASSSGCADASLVNSQTSTYSANGVSGSLHEQGSLASSTNINIQAGKNQGGVVNAALSTGTFDITGVLNGNASTFGQAGTIVENGNVTDTKTAISNVSSGLVQNSATGAPVTYLTPATMSGNANTSVKVAGSFSDPAKK